VVTRKRSARAQTAVLPARRPSVDVRRFAPSGRSVLLGLGLFALAALAYVGARETSVFAVQSLEVRGATPQVRAEVRAALAEERGVSLLKVDAGALDRRLADIPSVRSFTYDRAFPHTLRIVVHREWPTLVVRRGADGFLVSTDGRVVQQLRRFRLSSLPRLYVPRDTRLAVGETLAGAPRAAATALAPLRGAPLPSAVRFVVSNDRGLTFVLGDRFEVRLGDTGDLRLKLAIARRILRQTRAAAAGPGYLDVSVPERPVLLSNPQVAASG
jgi:cell division protein FtsQ